jgi:tRNA(Ile)-lysidine synthase
VEEGADLLDRVRGTGLLDPGTPLVAMLSGGRDSVCLLDLAARALGADAVTALHLNYGLREEDSDADEAHCRELCDGLGVALEVERAGRPEGSGNLQAWAREARYAAAERLAGGEAAIATGHTADDQVETILYRLASSPSRRALLGMRAREGRVVRPLLGIGRAETTAYCEARGLAWREDRSNEDPAYARNRVRRGLLPALAEVHPAAAANVLRTAELLREEGEVLDALVDAELDGSGGAPAGEIRLERLRELPPALRRLVVQRLTDAAAGRPVAGAANRAEEVAALTRGGSMLDLGSGVRAVLENGALRAELGSRQ